MLELIFQGFMEWAYGLTLECWEYFSSSLLSIMSMDYAYMKSHVPVMVSIAQVLLAVGWALLIGNLVFQALKSMAVGLGFEGEDPKLLFTRTFVFAFLLMASPQICEVGLSLTARIIELLEIPDAIDVTLVDEGAFGSLNAAWLLVIIFGLIIMFKVFRLLLEIAERYVILAVLTMTAPLAFAMGGSKSTSEIFGGWCRMFGSMCTLMVTNVIFFKMLLSVLANVPSGLDIIPWIVLVLTIVKVARKADAIITRIGLNPAITGDSLGRGFPGTLTYMVMRSATSHIKRELCAVVVPYRIPILIRESEMWELGEERPDFVLRNMVGASIDVIVTKVERTANRAQASRRQASRSQRRFFAAREDLHAVGSRITCRMLAVGPRRCLVDCYGYDLDMTQREIRYAAIPDLRTEFHPGSEIDCIVKEYHPRTGELIVSAKETEVNPFFGAEERHPVGSRRFAMISGKYGGGVFCNLPDGVTCMCNYSYQHEDADFMVGEHVMLMVQRYDQEKLQMYGKIMSKW